jgi:hypothetical protein
VYKSGKEVNLITGLDLRIGPDLALRAHSAQTSTCIQRCDHEAVHANTNIEDINVSGCRFGVDAKKCHLSRLYRQLRLSCCQLPHPRCLSTNPWTCSRTSFSSCPTPSTSSYSTPSPFVRQSSLSILIVSIRFILGVLPSFATGLHLSSNPTIKCVEVPPRLGVSISRPNTVVMSEMPRGHGSVDDRGVAVPGAPADRNETLDGCR